MHIAASLWSAVTYVTSLLTLSPLHEDHNQQPLLKGDDFELGNPGPVFPPPGGRRKWAGSDFKCDYSRMVGWEFCGDDPNDPGCWLRHTNGSRFDIGTDYEKVAPLGTVRQFNFTISDGTWNTDGLTSNDMQLVNEQYPGPWVQACWGDRIIVNVTNNLKWNGTAIHWHGIRLENRMHMDGVPGITQCPIAPKDFFVYDFTTQQYGSSWYHSHYSVQYANGLLGPMTIHGPHTGDFDEAKLPLLMSDWFHNSAFTVIHNETAGYPTILLNGTGDITQYKGYPKRDKDVPKKYTLHFEKKGTSAKRYLLRLINTSFTTHFLFSIDHHKLQIVSADFVPVWPEGPRTHIRIGIGQRYNVIVIADPEPYTPSEKLPNEYWIRTVTRQCFDNSPIDGLADFTRTGILRYDDSSDVDPKTERWPEIRDFDDKQICKDETHLTPRLAWTVTKPKNGNPTGSPTGESFGTGFQEGTDLFPLAQWSWNNDKTKVPLQINYSRPIFLELDKSEWPKSWVVVPEDHGADDFVCASDVFVACQDEN